jgi:hypothetical protein
LHAEANDLAEIGIPATRPAHHDQSYRSRGCWVLLLFPVAATDARRD